MKERDLGDFNIKAFQSVFSIILLLYIIKKYSKSNRARRGREYYKLISLHNRSIMLCEMAHRLTIEKLFKKIIIKSNYKILCKLEGCNSDRIN